MYWRKRILAAATAGVFAVSGGAYVTAQQVGQPPAPAQAPPQAAPQGQVEEADLEQFEGRIVDVVQFVQGQDEAEAPAEFGAPIEDLPGGGVAPVEPVDQVAQVAPPPQPGDAQQPDQPAGAGEQPGAAPPPQPQQQPAPPPRAGLGQPLGGTDGPVGLVKQDEENGNEQLLILAINGPAGPAQRPVQPGAIPPAQPRERPAEPAPAEPQEGLPPLPEPQQQDEPEQETPQFDIPGGGVAQVAPPAEPQQPPQQPAQREPAPAPQPGAGLAAPAGPDVVRSQADLERHIGDEVTLHGERHERAGVEVIIVHRIEREAPEAIDAPAEFGEPAQPQAAEPAPAEQSEQEDADQGFDFDW